MATPTCGTASPRKTLAGGPVQLVQIKNSLQPVIDQFNADKDKPRVVALLSPTCGGCIHAANAIFAEAVEAYPDEDLSVLVIWEPMLGSDNEAAARDSATIFDDPRVHQFWDADRLSGITYSTEVYPERLRQIADAMPPDHFLKDHCVRNADASPGQVPMWDFAVFYPAGGEWTETPPASSGFIRQLAIFKTPQGTSATLLTDDFTRPPFKSDWYDEVRREMTMLLGTTRGNTILASAVAPRQPPPADYPDSPTGRAAQALVEFTWTSGDDALREFVETRLTPASRERNSDATLMESFTQIRKYLPDASLQSAKKTGPLSAELTLVSDQTGTAMTMSIELEALPPHRIDRVRGQISPSPAGAAAAQCDTPPDAANVNALGVATTAPTPDVAAAMNLAHRIRTEGRVVNTVVPGSPADRAGLEIGDVILQLADNRLYSADDMTDFLAVAPDGVPIDVVVRRVGTTDDQRVRLIPDAGLTPASDRSSIDWQYAGLGQLEQALNAAWATGKPLLVGVTGSDTCCPFTRFEVDSLSGIVHDPRVIAASQDFVRIIIRRPHAYWFLMDLGGADDDSRSISATPAGVVIDGGDLLPIPSFYFLDADKQVLGNVALADDGALDKSLELMAELGTR
ncbi:MAG: PDZ domain-containing protein [Phycisphaerales bacterium]